MARILSDKEIRRLIGTVLIDADENFLNPNGIELRLGKHVLFHSTREEKELEDGMFLKVFPGETLTISSMETIDFRTEKVCQFEPSCMMMAFITPTTTMMREGISQVATKIDAGYHGMLNWGLRNGSNKDLILKHGEPIFKLTIFSLEGDELPETPYGEREGDEYQDGEGISRSTRSIPVDIPKSKMVSSSFKKLDPKKQLKEAGYPFDHIATELVGLDGKFEVVSSDVRMMKDVFQQRSQELTEKIQSETSTLSNKIEDSQKSVLEKVESIFDKKFLMIIGIVIGAISTIYGGVSFLEGTSLGGSSIAFITVAVGIGIMVLTFILTRKTKN